MFGLLGALNLGEQLFTAVVLTIVGWYILRGKSFVSTIVATVGMVTSIVLGVLGVLVVALAFGWIDPEPAVFINDISSGVGVLVDFGRDVALDWIREALP